MGQVAIFFALKVVSFLAALAQTIGFVGLFAFEALDPYKWQLLIGGTIAIMASEGLSHVLAKRMAQESEAS
jgi:hypothetical protein